MIVFNFSSCRLFVATILALGFTASTSQGQQKDEIKLWPNGLPAGSVVLDPERVKELKAKEAVDKRGHKFYVDSPTLTVYPAVLKENPMAARW